MGESGQFSFNYYLVGYMDLLGQRDALRRFPELIGNDKERSRILELLGSTFGRVHTFRQAFDKTFDSTRKMDPGILDQIPSEQHERFNNSRRMDIRFQYYSDCLAFFISLQPSERVTVPVYSVFGALVCCGGLFIEFMAKHIPFRGGIDVGTAGDFLPDEIYGPALVRAFDLESKVAKQPRIVIGNALMEYLRDEQRRAGSSREDEIARRRASDALAMIGRDVDGVLILDYLGKAFLEEWRRIPPAPPIQEAYSFVCAEMERFQTIGEGSLAARYHLVEEYMRSKMPIWDIKN